MSKQDYNKSIVLSWFTDFWGKTCKLDDVVDDLAAPNMLLQYSLHEPRRGREDIKARQKYIGYLWPRPAALRVVSVIPVPSAIGYPPPGVT
jgi:hypothetical protein